MSKSRDNKHRRQRAARKLADWRARQEPPHNVAVPVEIVDVKGVLPKPRARTQPAS
jgi:hypothetical protein